jgi:hypothetical protein
MPTGEQDVLRLDVTMDDAVLVRVRERVSHFARKTDGFRYGQLAFARQLVAK